LDSGLKVAQFTVQATVGQSARWKMAAESAGHRSVGTWIAVAIEAYLKARATAGAPIPLSWHRGHFKALLLDGSTPTLRGAISPPFGIYRGTAAGPRQGPFVLVYVPTARILATLHYAGQCKALAAELARVWVRWDGSGGTEPRQDPEPVLDRFRREDV
jgi:hypothetical protein